MLVIHIEAVQSSCLPQTKYTMEANPGPGWLCHVCAKASGADPFKKPAVPRKRKGPDEKRKVISFEDKEFPSLASMCIQVRNKSMHSSAYLL